MTAFFDGENQHERDQSTGKEVGLGQKHDLL